MESVESLSFDSLAVDSYPIFATLREDHPVCWFPAGRMWLVLRYEDCQSVLRDSSTFTTHSPDSLILDTFGAQMLSLDGGEQRRHRRPFNRSFSYDAVRGQCGAAIESRVLGLLDRASAMGELELRASFAGPLAMYTVADFLGVSTADMAQLRAWYDDFAAALSNFDRDETVRERGRASARAFKAAAADALNAGGGGILPEMTRAGELDRDALLSNALLILFGGIETTESMILNAVWALLTHSEALARVREGGSILNAVHESLRWDAAVQSCTRHAVCDVEFGGVHIRKGDIVQCMLGSANRDPAVFECPDRFDVGRANAEAHLTFGFGRHLCIGKNLALLEAEVAIGALLRRWPHLALDAARSSPPRGHEFRKPAALWLRWTDD